MSILDDFEEQEEPDPDEGRRDPEVDLAIESIRALLDGNPSRVFYSTEIETNLERKHFHWITARALLELSGTRIINTEQRVVQQKPVNFYSHKSYRYASRERTAKIRMLERIFDPEFTHAIGTTAELMFDSALSHSGYQLLAKNVNSWRGASWQTTNHNMDRIVSRDGIEYGIEIKNTQNYINRFELDYKIALCETLEVIPLFILRFAPKTYINKVWKAGGFVLLFEDQIYPMGNKPLMQEVRSVLGLKVHSPREIPSGHMERLNKFHAKNVLRRSRSDSTSR